MVSITDALIHWPTKNSFRLFWQLPCGIISGLQSEWNSVLTIQQWSRCCGPVDHEIRTWWCCFVVSPCWRPGTPWRLLLVTFLENQMPWPISLCISCSNASTSFGLGPAACTLDQKCQFYLSNGLAPSIRWVYRSVQRQFIDFCTVDGFKWFFTAH